MNAKEINDMLSGLLDHASQVWDALPAYSRTADCLADAMKSIEIAISLYKQNGTIPADMEKPDEESDRLIGKCPCCESPVTSDDNYCHHCGHRILWR